MKKKFTLLELNAVIGVSVLFLAQIPIAMQQAKRGVLEDMCLANKQKVYAGIMQYTNDFNGLFFIQESQKLWHGVLASNGKKLLSTNHYTNLNLRYITLDAASCPAVSSAISTKKDNWGMSYGIQRTTPSQMKERPNVAPQLGEFIIELKKNERYYGNLRLMKNSAATPLLMDTWHSGNKKGYPFFVRRNQTVGSFLVHNGKTGNTFADGSSDILSPDAFKAGFKPFSMINKDFTTFHISYK